MTEDEGLAMRVHLSTKLDALDALDARLDALDERLTALDERLDALDAAVEHLTEYAL